MRCSAAIVAFALAGCTVAPSPSPAPEAVLTAAPHDGPRYQRRAGGGIGFGRFEFDAPGTGLRDRTDALFLRFDTDPDPHKPMGFAFQLEAFFTDDDLFLGRTVFNGLGNAPATATAFGLDLYPHARFSLSSGRAFDVPIRAGVYVGTLGLDHDLAGVTRDFVHVGPRVGLEPTLVLSRSRTSEISLFGSATGSVGGTWYFEDWLTGDDSDFTGHTIGQLGAGLRFRTYNFTGELAWRFQRVEIEGLDSFLFGADQDIDGETQGLFLSFGGVF